MSQLAETQFGLNFLRTTNFNETTVFSPISIALALSLVHAGARGKSRQQLNNVILDTSSDFYFENYFSNFSKVFTQSFNRVHMNMANKLYMKSPVTVKVDFLKSIKQKYNAEAEGIDFTKSCSVQQINNYVKSATKGDLTAKITQDSVQNAISLLVNALSFSGAWENQWVSSSASEWFQVNQKEKKLMPMMSDFSNRRYCADDIFQLLAIKYADVRYEFSIFLPKRSDGLSEAVKKLNSKRFQNLLNCAKPALVRATIPTFTVEKGISLKNSLKSLGISEIFFDTADLSGIAERMKLSDGFHKAKLQINESGSGDRKSWAKKKPMIYKAQSTAVDFRATHPFLFALTYQNHPIFLGVYRG